MRDAFKRSSGAKQIDQRREQREISNSELNRPNLEKIVKYPPRERRTSLLGREKMIIEQFFVFYHFPSSKVSHLNLGEDPRPFIAKDLIS